jgi:hypothetical protein
MLRRKQRLEGTLGGYVHPLLDGSDESDETDDLAEAEVREAAAQFFADEIAMIDAIIAQAEACYLADAKFTELRKLANELVRHQGEKLLIFTEYRSTQAYRATRLERLWGAAPAVINGSMSVDEKQASIVAFEGETNVLISTEAGGEGLNLQRGCHVMVNYDLPWNPARLTQRLGRLYRYGQTERVLVVNFAAKDTIDNEILANVLERLDALVTQMASVSPEFDERYKAEVLGELLERLDIGELLDEASTGKVERSEERITAALERAQQARQLQDDILASADRLDMDGWQRLGAFTTLDLACFIQRASRKLAIEVVPSGRDEQLFSLRLPETMRGAFAEFGRRTVVEVRTNRGDGRELANRVLLDFSSSFVRYLVSQVTDEAFGGGYGYTLDWSERQAISLAMLVHYQNDQGDPRGIELVSAHRAPDGSIELDNRRLRSLFGAEQRTGKPETADAAWRRDVFEALADRVEAEAAAAGVAQRHANSVVALGVVES